MIFASVLCIVIILICIHKWFSHTKIAPSEPPLVSGWIPYLGVALEYGNNPKNFLEKTQQAQGDLFSLYIAGKILTVNLDPSFIKSFYRYPEETFDFYNGLRTVRLDEALGPTFHPKRAMVMMQILQNKFIPLFPSFIEPFISEVDFILQNTKLLYAKEGTVDTWKVFDRLVIALSLKSIVATHSRNSELCECIMSLEKLAQKLLQRPGEEFSIFYILTTGITGNGLIKQCENIRGKIYEILQPETDRRRELMKISPEKLPQDVLTIALQNSDDWELVRDAPVGVLFGAVANTNAVATLALWHICRDKNLLEAVHKEVDEVMKECNGVLDEQSLNKLDLLEACSMEVTRLYAISLSVRKVGDDMFLNGYHIPKGRFIAISSLIGMRNPEIFPAPDNYDPYRFMKGSKSYSAEQGYHFTGFGGGRHICKGMKLAKMELRILLATLIHRYEFSIPENSPEPDLEWISLGVAFPKSEVLMKYKKRTLKEETVRSSESKSVSAGFSPVSK